MKVVCNHGHFAFYPRNADDIGRFCRYYKTELLPENDYYTFPFLIGAPRTSIKGAEYLGLISTVNFEAQKASEVMKANGFVYSLALSKMVPASTIATLITLPQATNYYLGTTSLIQPGSLLANGTKIMSYDAEFIQKTFKLKVRSFQNE